MEEEEDDFYGGPAPVEQGFDHDNPNNGHDQNMDVTPEQDDEDDDDDSDDDVQFTLEKPEGGKAETSAPPRTTKPQTSSSDPTTSTETKTARSGTPVKQEQRTGSIQPTVVKSTLTHDGKEGKDFPEIRTSKFDINGTPTWANGKAITEVDIDADLAEHSKPWRLPGTDQTDFFNYGFDEYTWAQYCLRQSTMAGSIADQKQADANMKAMFGGGGGPGGGAGMPPGMPAMPGMAGMPSPEEMMQQMMSQGLNPSDPNAFMQMMMGGPMPGGGQGQQTQQQGGFGAGFGGQNNASPHPQGGQGFQPPSGPAAQNQGDQGGFGGNMEGFSPQQLAIMQQQQGGMQGGGRRGGRGRGRWH